VAVASAGPYASLHLAPDRQPRQHPTTQFLQAGCPSCRPTNSVKALKAHRFIIFGRNVAEKVSYKKMHYLPPRLTNAAAQPTIIEFCILGEPPRWRLMEGTHGIKWGALPKIFATLCTRKWAPHF